MNYLITYVDKNVQCQKDPKLFEYYFKKAVGNNPYKIQNTTVSDDFLTCIQEALLNSKQSVRNVMIYFRTHSEEYKGTYTAKWTQEDNSIETQILSTTTFQKALSKTRVKRLIIFIETCYAKGVWDKYSVNSSIPMIVVCSSQKDEKSYEYYCGGIASACLPSRWLYLNPKGVEQYTNRKLKRNEVDQHISIETYNLTIPSFDINKYETWEWFWLDIN